MIKQNDGALHGTTVDDDVNLIDNAVDADFLNAWFVEKRLPHQQALLAFKVTSFSKRRAD